MSMAVRGTAARYPAPGRSPPTAWLARARWQPPGGRSRPFTVSHTHMPKKAHQMPLLASGREEQYAAAAGGGEVGDGGGGTHGGPWHAGGRAAAAGRPCGARWSTYERHNGRHQSHEEAGSGTKSTSLRPGGGHTPSQTLQNGPATAHGAGGRGGAAPRRKDGVLGCFR